MSPTTLRRTARLIAATAAAVGVALGASLSPAAAVGGNLTVVGEPLLAVSEPATADRAGDERFVYVLISGAPSSSTDGEICTDWTNEDGKHETNCPEPSGGGGGGGGDAAMGWDLAVETRV